MGGFEGLASTQRTVDNKFMTTVHPTDARREQQANRAARDGAKASTRPIRSTWRTVGEFGGGEGHGADGCNHPETPNAIPGPMLYGRS